MKALLGFFILILNLPAAYAWDHHSALTAISIKLQPRVDTKAQEQVRAEPIEAFILAEQRELMEQLRLEEEWARSYAKETKRPYAPRPEALAFKMGGDLLEQRQRFLMAIRVNPNMKLPLYVQSLAKKPLESNRVLKRPPLLATEVSLMAEPKSELGNPHNFYALQNMESLTAFEALVSYVDEPDYGLDIGLFLDNGTEYGKVLGFGRQPFGNPALSFGTQAPFHMGFYFESPIIFAAAPFLKQNYPEFRVHQFMALSRFAFQTGHAYWGYRFAAWGLHYLQDLTQPYHSTVFPGVNVPSMLLINALDMAGIHGPRNDQVQLVSNRHLALENFAAETLDALVLDECLASASECESKVSWTQKTEVKFWKNLLKSMSSDSSKLNAFSETYLREEVAKQSNGVAARFDEILTTSLPALLVNDPKYVFGVTDRSVSVLAELKRQEVSGGAVAIKKREALESLLVDQLAVAAAHTRNYLFSVFSIR